MSYLGMLYCFEYKSHYLYKNTIITLFLRNGMVSVQNGRVNISVKGKKAKLTLTKVEKSCHHHDFSQ